MTLRERVTRCASFVYRAALVLCPATVRRRYGNEMCQTFEERCNRARHSMAISVILLAELADLTRVLLVNRLTSRRTLPMTIKGGEAMGVFWQDLLYAVRMLRRQPGFTVVAGITLALGIGATTAVFTVVNGVLLRPLPYGEPDRIVQLLNGRNGRLMMAFSPPNYRDVTAQSGVFSSAAAITTSSASLTGVGDPQQIDGADVTTSFFSVLGLRPSHGRVFNETEGSSAASAVVVIGDRVWRQQFGARADIVGSTIRLDGRPFTVIGIAPPELAVPAGAEFWRPLLFAPEALSDAQRGAQYVGVIARLRPGVALGQANSAIAAVAERLSHDYPRVNKDRRIIAIGMQERIVRGVRPALLILLGAVTLVLLVACVNVANLLLARASGRSHEVAVRAALGAGRPRLIRQFLAESLLLGLTGGCAGLAVALWSVRILVALGPTIPRLRDVTIDWRVLAFTALMAIVTSVLFGLVPAFAVTGSTVARYIPSGGRGSVGHGGARTRKGLVICEMALAVILLVCAGLLIRSYARISDMHPGFSADHVLTFTVALPETKYKTSRSVAQFVRQYVERLGGQVGIDSAAAVYGLPLDDNFSASSSFTRPGEIDSSDSPSVGMRIVTPDYFRMLKIPLRMGRTFDVRDDENGPEVVVINEEAARRYWPGKSPIGQQIHLGVRLVSGVRSGQKTIVGVVGDVRYNGLDVGAPPEVFLPHAQHPVDSITFAVRAAGDPTAFVPTARAELAALDRELPIAAVRTMDEIVGRSIHERRFTMVLLSAFATIAILLAAIGVYGVLAFVVSQRTQEIGVRLAIGARPDDVLQLFLREGATLALAGLVVGLVGALAASRALTKLLFGVTAWDPTTLVSVAGALTAAALCASWLPARRAARVDPMEALRAE